MNHMTAVTQTEAFSNLDESVMRNFIIRAAQSGAFKYWLEQWYGTDLLIEGPKSREHDYGELFRVFVNENEDFTRWVIWIILLS